MHPNHESEPNMPNCRRKASPGEHMDVPGVSIRGKLCSTNCETAHGGNVRA